MTSKPIGIFCLAFSSLAFAETTLEERVAALEERVAALEAGKTADKEAPAGNKADAPKNGVIFSEGFEAGVADWDYRTDYVPFSQYAGEQAHVAFKDNPRATKSLKYQDVSVDPVSGKRFLTFASEEKSLVVMNMNREGSTFPSHGYATWRGVHVMTAKQSIKLDGLKLPVLKIHTNILLPVAKATGKVEAHFDVGYVVKDAEESTYTLIQTFQENTEGWKETELDLSSLPKDKELRLVLRYFVCDARYGATTGVQIDDIQIFDDGI